MCGGCCETPVTFFIFVPHSIRNMKYRHALIPFIATTLLIGTPACDRQNSIKVPYNTTTAYIPEVPDYTKAEMWFEEKNDRSNTGADVFYVVATWEFDWKTKDSLMCHYADPVNTPQHCQDMGIEIKRVCEYLGKGNNFYAPYYRHITLNSWAENEDTINNRYFSVAFKDVQQSFNHFLKEKNHKRPFILAGFSQGAKSVVELIKTMPDSVASRMVAAYVMGYKVTAEDTAACHNLKPAKKATDTGVTICYNSVSDLKYTKPVLSGGNIFCINPANWKCDATPATIADSITVTLSPEHHVLVVKGFDGSAYPPILNMINVGDYHGAEPYLYQDYIEQNIKDRITAFYAHKK